MIPVYICDDEAPIRNNLEQIVSQEVEGNISDSEIEEFYNKNKNIFLASEPYVKGLFIKVPKTASGISKVKQWYKDNS